MGVARDCRGDNLLDSRVIEVPEASLRADADVHGRAIAIAVAVGQSQCDEDGGDDIHDELHDGQEKKAVGFWKNLEKVWKDIGIFMSSDRRGRPREAQGGDVCQTYE